MINVAAAPSEICDELPAVITPSGLNTGFSWASFSADESARMPSSRVIVSEPVVGHDRNRDDLVLEATLLGRAGGAPVGLQRERVVLFAGDPPLLRDHLRRDPLRHEVVALEHLGPERCAARQERRAHRHARHALDAGRDHDVVRAGDHALRREVRGLLRRAALTVDRRPGDGVGEAGRKRGVAARR